MTRSAAGSAAGSAWTARLLRAWTHRGLLARLLWPLSLGYGVLARSRRQAFATGRAVTHRVAVPVVVVGNVVAGGTGKTPLVIALVRHLQERGISVGVVARGYGRKSTGLREVTADSRAADVGDEPLLIHHATGVPVIVDSNRVAAARMLIQRHPQVQLLLCDDGLQHWALVRDVEICVFDNRGVGNGWLLPAGPLREAWPRPVSLVVHTGTRPAFDGFAAPRALAPFALRRDGTRVALDQLGVDPVIAVAGIAQPEAFFAMLLAAGVKPQESIALPDHYDFSSWLPKQYLGKTLICTEKDAVKLWHVAPDALAVPLVCQPEPALLSALDALIARSLSSATPAPQGT